MSLRASAADGSGLRRGPKVAMVKETKERGEGVDPLLRGGSTGP